MNDDRQKTIKRLSLGIMNYIEAYCEEYEVYDANVVLTAIGVAMSCFIDGSYTEDERKLQAQKAASTLIKCAESKLSGEELIN